MTELEIRHVVTIASHRTHTAAIMYKSTANDEWAYYQANSIKSHIQELGESILSVSGAGNEAAEWTRDSKSYGAPTREVQLRVVLI